MFVLKAEEAIKLAEERLAAVRAEVEHHLANLNAARGAVQMAECLVKDLRTMQMIEVPDRQRRKKPAGQ